ncbi:hypothetical protein RHSIM_Rhsim09G0119100 [Rhododendron simsii]|uniref:Uncharacterized protein n=1 Tax=Rhododendron simsii TaxID=118357 RepID=A0A834GH77_RHOSS|nr:hypothetical protein RHSIM_Rhsim09G0119100 [Rhododendron simsii]
MEKVSSKMVLLAILLLTVSGFLLPDQASALDIPCKDSLACFKYCDERGRRGIPSCVGGFCKCEASKVLKDRKAFPEGMDVVDNMA